MFILLIDLSIFEIVNQWVIWWLLFQNCSLKAVIITIFIILVGYLMAIKTSDWYINAHYFAINKNYLTKWYFHGHCLFWHTRKMV